MHKIVEVPWSELRIPKLVHTHTHFCVLCFTSARAASATALGATELRARAVLQRSWLVGQPCPMRAENG